MNALHFRKQVHKFRMEEGMGEFKFNNHKFCSQKLVFFWALWSTNFFLPLIFAQDLGNANKSAVRQIRT